MERCSFTPCSNVIIHRREQESDEQESKATCHEAEADELATGDGFVLLLQMTAVGRAFSAFNFKATLNTVVMTLYMLTSYGHAIKHDVASYTVSHRAR